MSKRRSHGEGSIYQRKADRRWVAMVNLGIVDGKRGRRAFTAKTRKEVQDWLDDIRHAQKQGRPIAKDKQTTAEYLERWLETKHAEVRPNTYERYAQFMRLDAIPAIGEIPLVKLGPDDVQRMLNSYAETHRPRTVHHLRAVLRTALAQAESWGFVQRNVARLAKPPRAERREMHVLNDEQTRTLLEAVRGDELGTLIAVAVTTGMRQGELLALRWRDVDLDQRSVQVRATLTWSASGPAFTEPKTAKSRRKITLTRVAADALREPSQGADRAAATCGAGVARR